MAVNVVSFSFSTCSTGGPAAQLSAGWWLSLLHLIGLVWLSLPHLVYNSVRSLTVWPLSWLTYIIVQRPLSHLPDLWNRMFDRHQAEITVMQFIGHSLPVHQSMSVPWKFFTTSHFISKFPPTRFPLITAIRMCHFLPVHHLEMAFLAGSKAKIQQIYFNNCRNVRGVITFVIHCIYKQNSALNNLQELIWHKTQPDQLKGIIKMKQNNTMKSKI